MKNYPIIGQIMIIDKGNNSYNWEQGCYFCKEKFGDDEKFMIS